MKYDDLLNVPFKWGGRDKSGLDCWGVVVECCRRAGTPVADPFSARTNAEIPDEEMAAYITSELNVREIEAPKAGAILYADFGGTKHAGYLVNKREVLHSLSEKGVKISPLAAFKKAKLYEVIT